MSLEKHARQLVRCTRCPLRENATCPVPGIGSEEATYFLIGEAPGKSEDKDGVPFVGASGKRLNRLLALAQIDINDCYLTNVVKCWPPKVRGKQRAPKKSERLACWPWLKQELQLVQPKIIIPLGAVPLSLFTDVGIKQLHGTTFTYELELDEA
uniref:Type-4 uracil-DNA glycosylase n=1 Tax=viral metagenome TaxID=1070528 RepID=A0A6M3XB50_9ZZZZ